MWAIIKIYSLCCHFHVAGSYALSMEIPAISKKFVLICFPLMHHASCMMFCGLWGVRKPVHDICSSRWREDGKWVDYISLISMCRNLSIPLMWLTFCMSAISCGGNKYSFFFFLPPGVCLKKSCCHPSLYPEISWVNPLLLSATLLPVLRSEDGGCVSDFNN